MAAFVLLWLLLLITARTVEEVRWVEALPALGSVATLALVPAYVLARSRLPVALLHALGLPAIALLIILTATAYTGTPEHLPLAVVLIAITALWCYVAAWSAFRYRSMWFAVVAPLPGRTW